MSLIGDILQGVKTTFEGLKVTVPYIWRKPVTRMYPHERPKMPERVRNRLYVNMDDCIGCDQCSRACPVNCITIETAKAVEGDTPGVTSNGKKKALWVTRFDIDIAKCCYCGLCTFPCPTECIYMTDAFEFAEQERNNLIYNYITLTPEEVQQKIEKAEEMEKELAAKKAAEAAEKKKQAEAEKSAPAKAAPPTPPPAASDDPEKAKKIAELQAKMAAAKAQKEGGAEPPAEASGEDSEKARKIAELQAKMAAARAKKEGEGAASPAEEEKSAPAPEQGRAEEAKGTDGGGEADADAEKAARIAELQKKIAEAKAKKEQGG